MSYLAPIKFLLHTSKNYFSAAEQIIETEFDRSMLMKQKSLRHEIFSIQGSSGGMFLWIRLVPKELQKSSTILEVKSRLKDLPRGLEQAYDLLFDKLATLIDSHKLRLAQNVLEFEIFSQCTMKVQEIMYLPTR
jgi:hypothetical protein